MMHGTTNIKIVVLSRITPLVNHIITVPIFIYEKFQLHKITAFKIQPEKKWFQSCRHMKQVLFFYSSVYAYILHLKPQSCNVVYIRSQQLLILVLGSVKPISK